MKYEKQDLQKTLVLPYPDQHLTLKFHPHPTPTPDYTPTVTAAIKKGRKVTNRASLVPHKHHLKTRSVSSKTNKVSGTTKYLKDLDAIQAAHHNRMEDDLFPDSATFVGPNNILVQREDHTQGTRLKLMIGGAGTLIAGQFLGLI